MMIYHSNNRAGAALETKSVNRREFGVIFAAVIIVFTFIYWRLFGAEGLRWDDDHNVFANPYFRTENWWGFWKEPYFGLYVPAINSVWAALYALGDGAALPFRILNYALHVVNVGLVGVLLAAFARRFDLGVWRLGFLFALSVFAFHPVQMGAVAWISGGRDLLATTFALLATLSFFRWPGWKGLTLGGVLFVLGLLSKPQIAALPLALGFFVLVFEHKGEGKDQGSGQPRSRWIGQLIGPLIGLSVWALMSVGVAWVTYGEQQPDLTWSTPLWFRPLVMLDTFGFYIASVFRFTNSTVDYGRTPLWLLENPSETWWTLLSVFLLVVFLTALVKLNRIFAMAAIWFILLLPVSGIVTFGFQQHSTVVDHYNYLPLVVVSLLCLAMPSEWWRAEKSPQFSPSYVKVVKFFVVFGLFSFMIKMAHDSWKRADVWSSNEKFFSAMLEGNSSSFMGHLGVALIECGEKNHPEVGVKLTERAVEMRPHEVFALGTWVTCLFRAQRYEDVVAVEKRFDSPEVLAGLRKNEIAAAEILATIGSAHFNLGRHRQGYDYLCQAALRNGVDPSIQKRMFVAYERLMISGAAEPKCGPRVDIEEFLASVGKEGSS